MSSASLRAARFPDAGGHADECGESAPAAGVRAPSIPCTPLTRRARITWTKDLLRQALVAAGLSEQQLADAVDEGSKSTVAAWLDPARSHRVPLDVFASRHVPRAVWTYVREAIDREVVARETPTSAVHEGLTALALLGRLGDALATRLLDGVLDRDDARAILPHALAAIAQLERVVARCERLTGAR